MMFLKYLEIKSPLVIQSDQVRRSNKTVGSVTGASRLPRFSVTVTVIITDQ